MKQPHLLVSISSHGFGHLSQTAPVLNALHTLRPDVHFTIRCALGTDRIRSRLNMPVTIVSESDDIGMLMKDAVNVDVDASLQALKAIHQHWQDKVDRLASWMANARVDAVLSNVAYLPLASAQQLGLPNISMSSLRWDAILSSIVTEPVGHEGRSDASADNEINHIVHEMRRAYEAANHFLCLTPCMPLPAGKNLTSVGPVCDPGARRDVELKRAIRQRHPDSQDCYLILVGMGGMPFEFSLAHWPRQMLGKNVFYLCEERFSGSHPHAVSVDYSGMSYSDLIASVDLVLTKPGYGTFTEIAMAGLPALYIERPNWVESEALTAWLQQVVSCRSISRDTLDNGQAAHIAQQLLAIGRRTPTQPSGNLEAARILSQVLQAS